MQDSNPNRRPQAPPASREPLHRIVRIPFTLPYPELFLHDQTLPLWTHPPNFFTERPDHIPDQRHSLQETPEDLSSLASGSPRSSISSLSDLAPRRDLPLRSYSSLTPTFRLQPPPLPAPHPEDVENIIWLIHNPPLLRPTMRRRLNFLRSMFARVYPETYARYSEPNQPAPHANIDIDYYDRVVEMLIVGLNIHLKKNADVSPPRSPSPISTDDSDQRSWSTGDDAELPVSGRRLAESRARFLEPARPSAADEDVLVWATNQLWRRTDVERNAYCRWRGRVGRRPQWLEEYAERLRLERADAEHGGGARERAGSLAEQVRRSGGSRGGKLNVRMNR